MSTDHRDPVFAARVQPRKKLLITMSPFLPIESNSDGTGGGIRLRVYGETGEWSYLDVVWGESTEIEVREVPS